jgi:hypothetical protein
MDVWVVTAEYDTFNRDSPRRDKSDPLEHRVQAVFSTAWAAIGYVIYSERDNQLIERENFHGQQRFTFRNNHGDITSVTRHTIDSRDAWSGTMSLEEVVARTLERD